MRQSVGSSGLACLSPSRLLLLAATAFIVYGTLYPFDFRSTGAHFEGWTPDWNPWADRADALDNVLLFVPFGVGLSLAFHRPWTRLAASVVGWVGLGLGLQWLQVLLPTRVASLADALNNALGIAIGIGTGWAMARAGLPRLRQHGSARPPTDPLLVMMVAGWCTYEAFPFVPTLDTGSLAEHLRSLLHQTAFEPLRLVRHLLAAALGTIGLMAVAPVRRPWQRLAAAVAALLLAEVVVPYGDLRLEALLGIVLGAVIGERAVKLLDSRVRWATLALALAAMLLTVLTPFRGPPGDATFNWTPFSNFFWNGSTRGVPTTAFEVMAVASLLWAGVAGERPLIDRAWLWPGLMATVVVVLEALRVALRHGPSDSALLLTVAMLAPLTATAWRRHLPTDSPLDVSPSQAAPRRTAWPLRGAMRWIVSLTVLALGLYALLSSPGLPYNVRELFPDRNPLRLLGFAAVLVWLGAGPWLAVDRASRGRFGPARLPGLLVGVAASSLLLLWLTVPQESLDDITGSTDLWRRVAQDGLWGTDWQRRAAAMSPMMVEMAQSVERGARFVALNALLLVPLAGCTVVAHPGWTAQRTWPALLILGVAWTLARLVVVEEAITDNLTELIADGGVPFLAALLLLFSAHAVWAARVRLRVPWLLSLVLLTPLAVTAGWWLLLHGLEQVIVKYDVVWSAQQFLLGRNRAARLPDSLLFARWCAVYLAAWCVVAGGMRLAWHARQPT